MNDAPPTAISELRRWPHWVMWRTVERDGKPTKVPLTPNGRPASSTDPETWSTHEACERALKNSRYDGIGYVFAETDEYFGVDLDHCVTNGVVHAEAMRIVQRLNSYTEYSPSGTGLHTIGRAAVNGNRNRTKKTPWGHDFEVYDQARFFTVTGRQMFGAPATIEARQEQLDAVCAEMFPAAEPNPTKANGKPPLKPEPTTLDDAALEEKIRSSKQGPKFAGLFDTGAPEGQESESDLGLCNILAFWLGPDEARIDTWFRRSALMRDKWDSPRGDTTYGGYTINRALEDRTEYYGQKKTRPAARPKDDDIELSYADELAGFFGLIDDTFMSGWRSSRRATCRVVLSTRGGLVFDVDNWKAATSSARALAQEIRLQIGTDPSIKKDDLGRLDVLIGQFCKVVQAMTVQDRAVELGRTFLQEAETLDVDLDDQAERYIALKQLKDRHPIAKAKADGTSAVSACLVLRDNVDRRYVRISWFVDFVKANAVSSQVGAIVEAMESPGMWSRLNNSKSRMKGTDPVTKDHVWQALYEVPANWPEETV
jgi:hypothetical protein